MRRLYQPHAGATAAGVSIGTADAQPGGQFAQLHFTVAAKLQRVITVTGEGKIAHRLMLLQLVNRLGDTERGQIAGRSTGQLWQHGDASCHQAVIFGFPGAQHAIHPLAQQINMSIVGAQRQSQIRIELVKVIQSGDHDFTRQRMRHINAYLAGGLQLMVAEQRVCFFQCTQQLHAALIIQRAFAGHLHLAGGADQQTDAEALLEPFEGIADRGTR
ncbi:hypothetical protein D3C73_1148150 [compost metagenome]